MVIMKFGGTSVQDAAAIERVAEIVRSRQERHPVVVVSAFAKVTDQLVLMSQQATAGDGDAALQLLQILQKRHFDTAQQLLGSAAFSKVKSKLESTFTNAEGFVRGDRKSVV